MKKPIAPLNEYIAIEVIKGRESKKGIRVKNIKTPRVPNGTGKNPVWEASTRRAAIARRPSSGAIQSLVSSFVLAKSERALFKAIVLFHPSRRNGALPRTRPGAWRKDGEAAVTSGRLGLSHAALARCCYLRPPQHSSGYRADHAAGPI